MTPRRTYTDQQLRGAIERSTSWRATLRELGLAGTSAGAMRSARSHADRLQIDHSHFAGQRRWTDEDLRRAVAHAETWTGVVEILGLQGGSAVASVKGHAARLELDCAHLSVPASEPTVSRHEPEAAHLSRAGVMMAAAWFMLCGYEVSWPLEPSRYDLLVCSPGVGIRRVQVKTTTSHSGATWKVFLSTTRRERRTYDPDEVDDFFIIDGDLNFYLIPIAVVGGLHAIHLRAYEQYRVPPMSAASENRHLS